MLDGAQTRHIFSRGDDEDRDGRALVSPTCTQAFKESDSGAQRHTASQPLTITTLVHWSHIHTNGIESFWVLLKRAFKGTQVYVDRRHLGRYVTERKFAYNFKDLNDFERMTMAMRGVSGRRLTWSGLTA